MFGWVKNGVQGSLWEAVTLVDKEENREGPINSNGRRVRKKYLGDREKLSKTWKFVKSGHDGEEGSKDDPECL